MRLMTSAVSRLSRRQLLGGLAATGAAVTLASASVASGAVSSDTGHKGPKGGAEPARKGDAGAIRVELPAPTGPYPVGMVELHLVDQGRKERWGPGDRELMVSVWYPARRETDGARVPYMRPGAAEAFGAGAAQILKIDRGAIDWGGFTTHARAGAGVAGGLGRRPVVLYSPGMYNERTLDTSAVVELAGQGYVVVTVDPTYEAHAVEFPDGRVAEASSEIGKIEPIAERNKAVLDVRVADVRFVLDRLEVLARGGNPDAGRRQLPSGLGAALDMGRVGMFGHSLGGMTTAEAMRLDRRIRAGANLDGPLGYDWTDPDLLLPVAHSGLDRPFLLMGAWLDTTSGRLPHTHEHSPSWRALWQNSTGWKRDLWTQAAEHNSFTDYETVLPALAERLTLPEGLRKQMIGTVDPARFAASRRAYLTAFFDRHLRGLHRPLLDGPTPRHPDVRFIG
ncbi:lipase [Streptomyces sp. ME19-01-6]|uniref:alpha/beta hydrolase family protein n=1 Tax=Streptomyces sp. ME19-01-6 TaxID=3028686 RepID=UPI0029A9BA0C|nr:lipase [Streptomyces sp. ME19-01-6]MDX3224698.1 lipase [Streptomyces sp. ME19-01-6]